MGALVCFGGHQAMVWVLVVPRMTSCDTGQTHQHVQSKCSPSLFKLVDSVCLCTALDAAAGTGTGKVDRVEKPIRKRKSKTQADVDEGAHRFGSFSRVGTATNFTQSPSS